VPELPEVEALTAGLSHRMAGRQIARCRLASFSALKTVEPPLDGLVGRTVTGGLWLVTHLARGGWVRWYDPLPSTVIKPGRSPIALRVGLDDGTGFDVTEMGTEKRLALWVVHSPEEVVPLSELGVDPLGPTFTLDRLAGLLGATPATVKNALTAQSLIAGVGNAYSDEALHRARLSPYKKANRLTGDDVARLHDALVGVLSEAVDRAAGVELTELKGDKKRAMAVHGRTGQACPVCGDIIREVSFATKSLQYCPTCQTGGRPLADRRLSRLLK
jgi:formamidopyrimidine-DNA glycosylase